MRAAGGGFARKAHFKKWYKKSLFAVFDCMLLNSFIAWNLSADKINSRQQMDRWEFYHWIAQAMMLYGAPGLDPVSPPTATVRRHNNVVSGRDHLQVEAPRKSRCSVCFLETIMVPTITFRNLRRGVVQCRKCGIVAHNHHLTDRGGRLIFTLDQFRGMTCSEIRHSEVGKQIWVINKKSGNGKHPSYTLTKSHPVIKEL